jgi:dihydropteroate synthase
MGILNVTPDSFSDGGEFQTRDLAVARAREMIAEGVDIIDIGGESTRPGADAVALDTEIERVIPVIKALRQESDIPISIDTRKPAVMAAAAHAGADLINDVRALQEKDALSVARDSGLAVCLMHMRGDPANMQLAPDYADVVAEVSAFLYERLAACEAAGIARERLCVDPGFGFGKTPNHNLRLVNRLDEIGKLGVPVLVGLSRKSTIARIVAGGRDDLLHGSLAGAVVAVLKGADIVRVHDVGPTVAALKVTKAVLDEQVD